MRPWRTCLLVIPLVCAAAGAVDPGPRYAPYPVLLVHGYNSTPGATFGAFTAKDNAGKKDARDVLMSSTYMIGQFGPHDWEDKDKDNSSFETDHLAYRLISALDDDGQISNASSSEFDAYYVSPLAVMHRLPDRYYPHEEDHSYSDLNHTYVEVYCGYWSYESNDGAGSGARLPGDQVKYGHFVGGVKDGGEECSGTGYGQEAYQICYGGQTQLLRIRIIQMLNEYYGDFKWVGDPTCRIKVVCHSNGGLVITNLLKNEEAEGWYHDGLNLRRQRWEDFVNQPPGGAEKRVLASGHGSA